MAARSLPRGMEPWKTLSVRVTVVRGRADIYASVDLEDVTGVVGTEQPRRPPIWSGVIAQRAAGEHVDPESCAVLAREALEEAFPTLW